MTGVITSLPPLIEQPPGNNASNPAGLPGVVYQAAVPSQPQTWTGIQTFMPGSIEFTGSISGNTFLNATAIASGVLTLPAATDTLVARNTTDTLTNKTLTNPIINGATIVGSSIAIHSSGTGNFDLSLLNSENLTVGRSLTLTVNDASRTLNMGGNITTGGALATTGALTTGGAFTTAGAFTTSGAFASTFTMTGTTTVTFPTTGTLATLAGAEALTNKTINGNTITAGSATLTLTGSLTINNAVAISAGIAGQIAVWNAGNLSGSATPTLGASGTIGSVTFGNATNGLLTLQTVTGALGAVTVSLPAATDTLVGKATTDTLTNKTYDTAGAGNSFKINGTAITAVNGSGAVALTTNASLVTPALGTPSAGVLTNCTGLPLAGLATQAAFTFVGNNTGSPAVPTAIDISTLTSKASPAATDLVIISDQAASGAWKKVAVSSLASAGSVASIAGNTGAFTLSTGITNATNDIRLVVPVTAALGGTGVVSPAVHTIPINAGASAQTNTGTGTIGQALVSGGASADPSYASGVPILLNTLTASGSASLSDTTSLTSTYNEYEIVFENILPATNAVTLQLLVHSGGVFKNTGYLTTGIGNANGGILVGVNPTTFLPCSHTTFVSNTAPGVCGRIRVFTPSTSAIHQWIGEFTMWNGTNAAVLTMSGFWNTAAAIDGFQVSASTGNLTSGILKVYAFL